MTDDKPPFFGHDGAHGEYDVQHIANRVARDQYDEQLWATHRAISAMMQRVSAAELDALTQIAREAQEQGHTAEQFLETVKAKLPSAAEHLAKLSRDIAIALAVELMVRACTPTIEHNIVPASAPVEQVAPVMAPAPTKGLPDFD